MDRAGIGYDSHRFADGRPLILGGVAIPAERGLAGHSDADAVCHAVIDALLGAAGAGDIGTRFPDTDPRWKDARSLDMLRTVVAELGASGIRPRHVDVTVILERPKLADFKLPIAASLAGALGLHPGSVSLKAKTNEGMGFVGRGEGIAVLAVATVEGP
ncbi:MAG: 2-C-methyl-D-erythritol 2,4-cyclodiphosphate synthase [Gemmatimonadetes bacterium]|nr:2-C-methyl-D-erythritol 2,4-cyclodiphosphate synthase [Gemmatimonadota bacterium]